MKRILLPIFTLACCVGSLNAATIVFSNLDTPDTSASNALNVGGSKTGLTVTRTAPVSGDFLYAVTYLADFGGSIGTQTLSYSVRVEGFTGGTVTNSGLGTSSATIGSTDKSVIINDSTWRFLDASSNPRFPNGDSLKLTIENISVTGVGNSASFQGFTALFMAETTGSDHQTVFGSGTGLNGYTYGNNLTLTGLSMDPLYVSGANGSATNNKNYGLQNVSFQFDVANIPEPSSLALLGLGMGAMGLVRRRRRN